MINEREKLYNIQRKAANDQSSQKPKTNTLKLKFKSCCQEKKNDLPLYMKFLNTTDIICSSCPLFEDHCQYFIYNIYNL